MHMQGSTVVKRIFAAKPDAANTKLLKELLDSAPKVPLYILADVIDQSYVRHDLPPVSSMSVGKLIKRRLDRDFSANDFKGAMRLGRDGGGRKDWNYLLISLANNPPLSDWVTLTLQARNPFKGVYLVPVEAQQIITKLATFSSSGKSTKWRILVSHHKVGGFRQVVLKEGRLVFTRLAQPIGETVPEVIAGNIEQEVQNTIEYIRRLSFTEQAGLELFIIVSQEIKNAIEPAKLKASQVHVYTPYEAASALSLDQAALPGDHFGDVVLAAFFSTCRKHALKLHTSESRKKESLHSALWTVKTLCVLICVTLIGYTGYMGYGIWDMQSSLDKLEREESQANQMLNKAKEEANKLPADVNTIGELVAAYELFSKGEFTPFDFISQFSAFMSEEVRVSKFSWKVNDKPETTPGEVANDKDLPVTIELTLEFLKNTGDVNSFVKFSNAFFADMRASFAEYEITTSKLPGTVEDTESLEMDFSKTLAENSNMPVPGKPIEVTVVFKGLKKKSDPAAPQGIAPPAMSPQETPPPGMLPQGTPPQGMQMPPPIAAQR